VDVSVGWSVELQVRKGVPNVKTRPGTGLVPGRVGKTLFKGRRDWRLTISETGSFGRRNTLPAKCFALFPTPEFAWFFVAFLKLQALEKTVILDLFFQNAHGLLKIVVDHLNFDCLQAFTPPSFHPDTSGIWLISPERWLF
jgi:hypothetical protein